MAFVTPIDIANRALQHLSDGGLRIATFQDTSQAAREVNRGYDDLRLAELSRHTWAFSLRKARVRPITLSAQTWLPPTYVAATTYTVGQVVMFAGGTYANSANYPWILQVPSATGLSPDISPQWSHYFGSLIADVFNSGAIYAAGEVVLVPEQWLISATYPSGAIVNFGGIFVVSLANNNIGQSPATTIGQWWATYYPPAAVVVPTSTGPSLPIVPWALGTTFTIGELVTYQSTDGNTYTYIALGTTTGNEPDISPANWSVWGEPTHGGAHAPYGPFMWTDFNGGVTIWMSLSNNNGSPNIMVPAQIPDAKNPHWTLTGGTITQFTVLWPLGTGPYQPFLVPPARNLYPLPFGWLRPAIHFAKNSAHPWLGALVGPIEGPDDYTYYGKAYFSDEGVLWSQQNPFIDLTFVADIADVTTMPPQFCESLAIRIADELDGPLGGSTHTAKLENQYRRITGEALRVDSVVQGSPVQPIEEFVRVRI
jgi:hypothetical protein